MVLVALGDKLLDDTFEEIKTSFPKQQFRKVRRCAMLPQASSLPKQELLNMNCHSTAASVRVP